MESKSISNASKKQEKEGLGDGSKRGREMKKWENKEGTEPTECLGANRVCHQ